MFFRKTRGKKFKMIWSVEKDGRKSFLAGTAHFFPHSFKDSLAIHLQQAETVIFEGPLDEVSMAKVSKAGEDHQSQSHLFESLDQPFEKEKLGDMIELAVKEFHSETVSLLAPSIPPWRKPSSEVSEDVYYRLEIERLNLSGKLRNMITRASREVTCDRGRELHEEHLQLIREFSKRPGVEDASRRIFAKVPGVRMLSWVW
jgi:hypothetical protein